jgi:hypothetical protein
VTLADLKLRPLDLLAIAQDETRPGVDTELERRILQAKPRPAGSGFRVDFAETGSTAQAPKLSFPQVMELCRALAVVLGAARPITAADLLTPLEATEVDEIAAHAAAKELMARARAAHDALLRAQDDLGDAEDTASRRTRLVEAARLVAGAFPPVPLAVAVDEDAQIESATAVALGELGRRVNLSFQIFAREPTDDDAADATAAFLNQKATDLLKAVFGASFVALPGAGALRDTAAEELRQSLAARELLLGNDPETLQDSAPTRFLQQVALVRDGTRNWRALTIYARALGRAADRLAVMQLPHTVDEAWAGRAVPPAPGRVSLLAFAPAEFPPLDPGQNLRGLLLDDWVEAIPRATEETAVAFHYDHPNAEAPQVVLVAVPAGAGPSWSFDELLATVNETFELTDVRSIDPESLNISPLLPAPVLAFGPGGHTVSTDLSPNKLGDRLFNLL